MRRYGFFAWCVVLATLVGLSAAKTAERVALVVGNSAYQHLEPLDKARANAEDMAQLLGSIGYDVVAGYDLTGDEFRRLTRDFASRLDGSQTAIIYYAGHGFESDDISYMVPVDGRVASVSDLVFATLSIQDLLRVVEKGTAARVLLLDSYLSDRSKRVPTGPFKRGFAAVEAYTGSYIAMAAQPGGGQTMPGDGRNTAFTAALLKFIGASSDDIDTVMRDVADEVVAATGNRQRPWLNSGA